MNKKIFLILILVFLNQCGYSNIYKNENDTNLKIIITSMEGDTELNKKINSELKQYFSDNMENIYSLKIFTKFNKFIISRDAQGKVSTYELLADTNVQIKFNETEYEISINESLKVNDKEDSFEQRKYENIVKVNFAKSIKEKLILKLKTLK